MLGSCCRSCGNNACVGSNASVADISTNDAVARWVRENGLPSLEQIQTRIDIARAPTAGKRGRPKWTAATIQLALVARAWRAKDFSVRQVALALSDDPMKGRPRTDKPVANLATERRTLERSREQAEREAVALEERIDRAEDSLQQLEDAEGQSSLPLPDERERQRQEQQRNANVFRQGLAHRRKYTLELERVDRLGIHPDDDQRRLCAEAAVLEDRARTRPGEQEELLAIAARLRWRADALKEDKLDHGVIRRKISDGQDPRDPDFDPFTAPLTTDE